MLVKTSQLMLAWRRRGDGECYRDVNLGTIARREDMPVPEALIHSQRCRRRQAVGGEDLDRAFGMVEAT
jgi:hypothetical protein